MTRHAIYAIALLLFTQFQALAFQEGFKRGNKKPETSSVAEFNPTTLTKIAVLVVGSNDPRDTQMPRSFGSSDSHAVQAQYQRLVEDVFLESLLAKGHTVVARSDVDSVMKEKRFQESGMTEELATNVGKLLNVPAVLVIRITEISTETPRGSPLGGKTKTGNASMTAKASLGARLISVETGAILWNGKHSETLAIGSKPASSGLLLQTAAELAESFPEKKSVGLASYAKTIDPKSIPKLAVIMVGGATTRPSLLNSRGMRGETESDQQRLVEDAFIQVLIQKGYGLVSRSDLQSVAKEQRFQQSGLTEDNAVAVGKLLKVPAVLVVQITEFTTEAHSDPATRKQATISLASLGARLVDVHSGEFWWAHSDWTLHKVNGKSESTDLLEKSAKDVVNFIPPLPEARKTMLSQAERLETMCQIAAAQNYYRTVIKNFPDTSESTRAGSRLKALTGK